ncbi:unnamed protein product [Owenia fusiformis]|uniref:Uncharacterized protein n=1 Tax=Owenia fusiformis TaxID=6347 RepID=A0A8J1TIP9_OWEFU|nr:unnamed protein product [Owenia fusiformis]
MSLSEINSYILQIQGSQKLNKDESGFTLFDKKQEFCQNETEALHTLKCHKDHFISSSPMGNYCQAAAVSPTDIGSETAKDILSKGGSAVDACIAALLCNAVANPQYSGLGGGLFMTIYKRNSKKVTIIDARETAPSGSTEHMFINSEKMKPSILGGLAIAVPGDVKGMWEAHKLFGKLPWEDLFQPAISLAEKGASFNEQASKWAKIVNGEQPESYNEGAENFLDLFEELRSMVTKEGSNELLQIGDTQKRPKLAETLKTIAREGGDAFYEGSLTGTIVDEIRSSGGIITADDLNNYKVKVKEAFTITLQDGTVLAGPPPPASSAVVQYILALLDGFDLEFSTIDEEIESYHKIAESIKMGFARRTCLGDLDCQVDSALSELVDRMSDPDHIDSIRSKLSDRTFPASHYSPYSLKTDGGTAQISILAPNGDAVSLSSSLNFGYGSLVKGKTTGIIYNNAMDDFSTPGVTNEWGLCASPYNYIVPGKRMQSSMAPIIAIDGSGDVVLVQGCAGGPKIIPSSVMAAFQVLKHKKTIKEALDFPRIHHQLDPDVLLVEEGISEAVIEGLREKGHVCEKVKEIASAVQAIHRKGDSKITANSDYRRVGGGACGF